MTSSSKIYQKNVVLIMGLTGAGKTYFINQLTGRNLELIEGHMLRSCWYSTGDLLEYFS
jgi:predicted GTPase